MNNFLESVKSKTISEVKREFEKRLDEYNKAACLYMSKKQNEK